jgi:hypothetical protein
MEPESSLPHSQEPATCPYQILVQVIKNYGFSGIMLMPIVVKIGEPVQKLKWEATCTAWWSCNPTLFFTLESNAG